MRRRPFARYSPGLTLAEILAVLSIIILVSILALPALNLFRSQSLLRDAARTVQSMLDEARGMAIAQGKNFTVRIDTTEESLIILDGTTPASKKWLAPAAVDITDVSGRTASPDTDITFKPTGGSDKDVSVHLKRRDADPADASKYYTVTVINTTGVARTYPTKQN